MEGTNHILQMGNIKKHLHIYVIVILAIAGFSTAAFISSQDTPAAQVIRESDSGITQTMISLGDKQLKRLEKEEEEALKIDDPEELRQKALVLEEEARQAQEYANELAGTAPEDDSFKQDYNKYLALDNKELNIPEDPEPPQPKQLQRQNDQQRKERFDEVRHAPTRLNLGSNKNAATTQTASDGAHSIRDSFNSRLENAFSKTSGEDSVSRQSRTMNDYQAFNQGGNYELSSTVNALKSPWCLRQGSVIPAMLTSAINSDLPGLVTAQTTADVLDSITGSEILIPRGTRITGEYGASPGYGEERVFIGFQRLLFPDGSSLDLGAMPGQSEDGKAGFDADVDSHFMKVIGSALLLSAVSAGVSVSQSRHYDADGREKYGEALNSAATSSLGSVLSQVIEKNLSLSPTLNVKPGYSFSVAVAKDIYFNAPWGSPDFAINS